MKSTLAIIAISAVLLSGLVLSTRCQYERISHQSQPVNKPTSWSAL